MMRRGWRQLFLVLLLSVAPWGSRAIAFELEGFGGGLTLDEVLRDTLGIGTPALLGLRIGGGGRHILAGETTIAWGPTENLDIVLLMGNLIINIPAGVVYPFATIGTGTSIYIPSGATESVGAALQTETRFTLNYGGGARVFLNNFLAVRGDFRDYVTFDLVLDPKLDPKGGIGGTPIDVGTAHSIEVSGGLSFVF